MLNDLQAQGHAIGHVDPALLSRVVVGAEASPLAAKLVIGVGTGFNSAPVYDTADGRYVPPSESGHATCRSALPPTSASSSMSRRITASPTSKSVLSGRGLEHIYLWLGEEAGDPRENGGAADIMEACAAGTDARAREAVACFVRLLGLAVGNLALMFLPFGGVYLTGGVARAVRPICGPDFADAFRDKGRFADFMAAFRVTVVEDDYAALSAAPRTCPIASTEADFAPA